MANSDDTDLRASDADDLDPDSDFDDPRASGSPPRFGRLALCVAAAGALSLGVIGTVAYGVWFNHDQQAYAEAMTRARRALGSSEPAGTPGLTPSATRPAAPLAAATQLARDDDTPATAAAPATSAAPVHSVANDTHRPDMAAWTTPAQPSAAAIPDGPDPAAASMRPATTREATDEQSQGGHAIWSGQIQPGAPAANSPTTRADASPAAPFAMSTDTLGDAATATAGATSANGSTNATPDLYSGPASPANTRPAANAANSPTQQRASNRPAKNGKLAQQDRRAAPSNAKHEDGLFARVGQFFRRVSYRQHGSGRQQQQDIYSHP